ncbi:hypothetical protein VNO78_19667 [Psophocarpus tetragonolobus]|uniref:Uncharacterized protein n=1 Tax=Psophocarpus tetragonolobus TaxID=3891 RepID=A0AAN9XGD6_PSOTE
MITIQTQGSKIQLCPQISHIDTLSPSIKASQHHPSKPLNIYQRTKDPQPTPSLPTATNNNNNNNKNSNSSSSKYNKKEKEEDDDDDKEEEEEGQQQLVTAVGRKAKRWKGFE